jgi:hypothetical protein
LARIRQQRAYRGDRSFDATALLRGSDLVCIIFGSAEW